MMINGLKKIGISKTSSRGVIALLVVVTLSLSSCSLDNLVSVDDAEGGLDLDRGSIKSREGALKLYAGSFFSLQQGVSQTSKDVALITDEISIKQGTGNVANIASDSRTQAINEYGDRVLLSIAPFQYLQTARIQAAQARSVLSTIADTTLNYLIAATYAIEGYSTLIMAENYCSGIPISTFEFEGDLVYSEGKTTAQLMGMAVSKFDSALAVSHDSTRFRDLAKLGKARAFLGLNKLDSAFTASSDVQNGSTFLLTYTDNLRPGSASVQDHFWTSSVFAGNELSGMEVMDREGRNGLVWYGSVGSPDPRVPIRDNGTPPLNSSLEQRKYTAGSLSFPLADWKEASLIAAEYYLSENDPRWLTTINDLRRTVGLADTTDPGTAQARVNLLFRERAFWFYLNGVRLGDFRRLVRFYGRSANTVYPIGPYMRVPGGPVSYGEAFVFSPPTTEMDLNFKYKGCEHANP